MTRKQNNIGTCFIPNLKISKTDKNYDKLKQCNIINPAAFIKCGGYFQYGGMGGEITTYCCGIVFDSQHVVHENSTEDYQYDAFEYVLPEMQFFRGCSLVYSSNDDSIISHFYGENDSLYQLKLNEDELKWTQYISAPPDLKNEKARYWKTANIKMKIIGKKENKLFTSNCVYNNGEFLNLYNFDKDEWIKLARFSDKHYYIQSEGYYYHRQQDKLYSSVWFDRNNLNGCDEFNLYKNKWYKLPDFVCSGNGAIIWMNEQESDQILNVILRPNYKKESIPQLIDLRSNSRKWQDLSIDKNVFQGFDQDCHVFD